MLIHLPSISTRCIRSTPQTAVSSRKPSCPYPNRSRRRSAGPTRHGRSRSLHKLDREPIEVFDHQRPCISKWMRIFENRHALAPQSLEPLVQIAYRERHVVVHLSARRDERLIRAASPLDTLAGIP